MSTLYGVGVGPGDPEYMTLKAVRIIKECDVIAIPAKSRDNCYAYKIVYSVIPEIEDKEVISCVFPMTKNSKESDDAHEKIYKNIQKILDRGLSVAFLTIGDPSVYSTYAYVYKKVLLNGGKAEIVCGVTSFCAVSARLGIPLAEGDEEIHIIPASRDAYDTDELTGTKIYMKAGSKLKDLIYYLSETDRHKQLNVYAVANCGMENEKVYRSLEELSIEQDQGYLVTVIVRSDRD